MNKFLTLILIAFPLFISCNSGKEKPAGLHLPKSPTKAGIGLIHFNTNHPIALFKTQTDTAAFDTLQFIPEKQGIHKGKCNFSTHRLGNRLKPYLLCEGDSESEADINEDRGLIRLMPQIVFRVVQKNRKGVVVMLNEQTAETAFIGINPQNDYRKNPRAYPNFFDPNFPASEIPNWYYFETWEQALIRAFCIAITPTAQVFDEPNGNRISIDRSGSFKADSVQNQWIRLTNAYCNAPADKKIYGWVKWKENDSITVTIILNGGYE